MTSFEFRQKLKTDYNDLVDKYNKYNSEQSIYKEKYYKAAKDYNYLVCGQKNLMVETREEYLDPIEPVYKKIGFAFHPEQTIEHYNYIVNLYNYKVKYYNWKTKFHEIILKSKGHLGGEYKHFLFKFYFYFKL